MRTQPVNPMKELEEHKRLIADIKHDDFHLVQRATKDSLRDGWRTYRNEQHTKVMNDLHDRLISLNTFNAYMGY